MVVMTGRSSSEHCKTSEVGIGSKQDVFLAERDIIIMTSSMEKVLNSDNETSTLRDVE